MKKIPFILSLIFIISFSFVSCSSDSAGDVSNGEDVANNPNISYEIEIMNLINAHRVSKGLAKLEMLAAIKTQTALHTDYMIKKGKISHDLLNQRSEYLKKNANAKSIAENVASGYATANTVVTGWLNSTGHRENIEGNYTHFELTAKQNASGKWYYTNIFIKK
ncbi:Cysteine-rich secretory protein family protein [Tenacibaculum sp. 190524A02b]|uniref:Cysteine-rich secretory protein family protein n=1 Tax=Tenacibaculum vairaonense TaxID=3137860 RepID=A0ABP1FAI5_9FLAO